MFTIWRGSLYYGETDLRISKESVSDNMFTIWRCSLYGDVHYIEYTLYGEFTVLYVLLSLLCTTSGFSCAERGRFHGWGEASERDRGNQISMFHFAPPGANEPREGP